MCIATYPEDPDEAVCLLSDLHGPDDLVLGRQVGAVQDVWDLTPCQLKILLLHIYTKRW